MKFKLSVLTLLLAASVGGFAAGAPAAGQIQHLANTGFEAGFATLNNPDTRDGGQPDAIPEGWQRWESFTGAPGELSYLLAADDNGPSQPGTHAARLRRTNGGASGDETMLGQYLSLNARDCASLRLNLDLKVISHNLEAGGYVVAPFEWPAMLWINYTTTSGSTQIWRHGWYLDPPGDSVHGPVDDPGQGLIPFFNDAEVEPGVWTSASFDLKAELPQLARIDRLLVGGAGWDFESLVDNVELVCSPNLRLHNGRFLVESSWRTSNGLSGQGTGVQLTDDAGYFWFFRDSNPEVFVKLLDACVNPFNRYWVFVAGMTNVEVELRLVDLATGVERTYTNPQSQAFLPIQDTQAFSTCAVPDPLPYCLDFDGVAPGTMLGAAAGNVPGQVIFNEDNIRISVENFYFENGGTFFGDITFVPASEVGEGVVVSINNLSFEIDFSHLPYQPRRVTFDFWDQGGNENLALNRQPSPPYHAELMAAPCPLGGVVCDFNITPEKGVATFVGEISYLRLGGQELIIDNLCAWPK